MEEQPGPISRFHYILYPGFREHSDRLCSESLTVPVTLSTPALTLQLRNSTMRTNRLNQLQGNKQTPPQLEGPQARLLEQNWDELNNCILEVPKDISESDRGGGSGWIGPLKGKKKIKNSSSDDIHVVKESRQGEPGS